MRDPHQIFGLLGACVVVYSALDAFSVESAGKRDHFSSSPRVHEEAVDAILRKEPDKERGLFRYKELKKVVAALPSERRLDVLMTVYYEAADRRIRRTVTELISSCCKDSKRRVDAWAVIAKKDRDVFILGFALHELAKIYSAGELPPTLEGQIASSLLGLADESNPDVESRSSAIVSLGVFIERCHLTVR